MAEGLNRVMLIGNLGQTPELRYTQGGQAVLKLRMATNERYKDRNGEWQDRAEWHTVVVWGKRGEGLNKVLAKGSQLYVEGRLQTRSWEDNKGQQRYTTEVVARDVLLLGGRGRGPAEERPAAVDDRRGDAAEGGGGGNDDAYAGAAPDFTDDDIPF